MRRAPSILAVIAVAVSACLGGTACGPDLPDRMWRSDNVRYFSRPGDDSVCPAILDEIEQHGQLIADALMLPSRTLVSYYKFDGLDDYDHNAECGSGAAACSINATARSPVDFDRHELIHAYLSPYGRPPWLVAEGAAVALSCQRYPRPTGTWQEAYVLPHDSPALYAAGANYVTAPRLLEAADLLRVLDAAEKKLLDQKRQEQIEQLEERNEVVP